MKKIQFRSSMVNSLNVYLKAKNGLPQYTNFNLKYILSNNSQNLILKYKSRVM